MADMNDQRPEDETQPVPPEESFAPTEEEDGDEAPLTPRRAASAEFIVESDVGTEAALREAMDPANQSLGDALRLSFRVLQAVIVILVGLFLVSGFESISDGQSGVMLRFGRIVKPDLEPGAEFNILPYPAGEFVLFDTDGRSVETGRAFMPNIPQGQTLADVESRSNVNELLKPDSNGYVLLSNADMAHFKGSVSYRINSAKNFVTAMADDGADRIVLLAFQRAIVHVASEMSLQDWTSMNEVDHDRVIAKAQEVLTELDCGIKIRSINVQENIPPLAIRKIASALQTARNVAVQQIDQGREQAERELISAAGEQYGDVLALIDRYEAALNADDDAAAERELDAVNDMLQSGLITGQVKNIVGPALSHRSTIVETMSRELETFNSVYELYKDSPELVARSLWLEAYQHMQYLPGMEVMYLPRNTQDVVLRMTGSEAIATLRRELRLNRAKNLQNMLIYGRDQRIPGVNDSKRMLNVGDDGGISGFGSGE